MIFQTFFEREIMALIINNHTFSGTKSLLGGKHVTYASLELPLYNEHYDKAKSFDWGLVNNGAKQLAFAMLYQVTKDATISQEYAEQLAKEVLKYFGKKWSLTTLELQEWIDTNIPQAQTTLKVIQPQAKKIEEIKVEEYKTPKTETILPPVETKPANKVDTRAKNRTKKRGASKDNIVKRYCKEMGITQKELAKILEVPEGTVSSWAVKDEIPRLGKKAIEFYLEIKKKEEIIASYKNFVDLVQHTA